MTGEGWLASLDPIGWRFGLERIKALLGELGDPQQNFQAVHVVGTNGKSSVTQMAAAILEESGLATGAYLSPHTARWAERVRIGLAQIPAAAFDQAIAEVAAAAPAVEGGLAGAERITQFEAATAAAFVALRNAEVQVGVIEAGLGGRLDATNVLESKVTVLTSIGLDHMQWLGDTEAEIAAEKLAVLRPGSTLVLGAVPSEVEALAREHAAQLGAELVDARSSVTTPYGGYSRTPGAMVPYLRRNLAVAIASAEAFLERPLDGGAIDRALGALTLPGRFELSGDDPPVIRDAAHNPDGAAALAEALREHAPGRPVVACLAVLGDKDAAGIVRELAPALAAAVVTEVPAVRLEGAGRPGTTSVGIIELGQLCEETGLATEGVLDPSEAIACTLARARETGGVALIAGSHYLLGY